MHFLKHIFRRQTIKKIALFSIVFGVFVVLAGIAFFFITISDLPSLELLQNHQVSESTKIYDRTGKTLLYEIYGEEKRTVIPFEQIPERIKQATIAIEDANFYNHSAIDFKSLLRAQLNNIGLLFGGDGVVQGGSTITQQLAKKAFLTDDRTLTRKFKEAVISYKLEQAFTKDQILELYLNQIPYGSNAYGIESAAQTYFQKPALDLSLAETAVLAALPQAPSYYSPFGKQVNELLDRKNLVLRRMNELGYITTTERLAAEKEKIKFGQLKSLERAPHFALAVKEYLDNQYGEDFVRRSGLKVITTLDTGLQESAEKAVAAGAARNTELYKGTNAALVAQDSKTGQILAMVGSRNFFDKEIDGQFNVATQGLRQPGSALKPFVYLAALKAGYPEQTVLFDTATEFNGTSDPSKSYKPNNYDEQFRGPINFRNALAQSINVPAVKTLYLVGVDNFLNLLHSFGINTLADRSRFGLSLVLGGGEVRLQELVGAYSVLSQEGVRHDQHLILSVTDQNKKVLEEYRDVAEPVIEPEYVRIINDILSDKNARAPLFSSSLNLTVYPGYDVALKTGTTNDYRDAWSIGYTPSLVAGVWAGNNDNVPMERRGGSILAAVPILNAFLREALPTTPAEAFTAADPVRSNKPMLNGEYLATYQSGNQLYPQIHDILQYVDRRNPTGPIPLHPEVDPQYTNWEQGVLAWATSTIPGIQLGYNYNQPLPPDATLVETQHNTSITGSISLYSPENGSFIKNNQLPINAQIQSQKEIIKIEVFFNNQLVDVRNGSLGTSPSYQTIFGTGAGNKQNTLKITATDSTGVSFSKEVTVYQ
jgi:1A family penicillin-binding protein